MNPRPLARWRPALSVVAALCALLVVGCQPSPEQQLTAAREEIARGNPYGAVLTLKSLLADADRDPGLRLELGRALYLGGNAVNAELELRKAIEFGAPKERALPLLAKTLALAGKHRQLLEEFGSLTLDSRDAQAEISVALAQSHAALGQPALARQRLDQALKTVPQHVPAESLLARLQADAGDTAGAMAVADALIQRSPGSAEAWQLKGDLLSLGRMQRQEGLAAYRKAVELEPTSVQAHSAIIRDLIILRDVAGARAQLEQLDRLMPKQPHTAFYAAQVALLAGEVDRARQIAQALLQGAPDSARVLHLAGNAELKANSLPLAESLLQKALQFEPEQKPTRLLLAETYLRLSNPESALATLRPLLEGSGGLAQAHRLAGHAHMLAGRWPIAQSEFAKALQLDPDSRSTQAELASSRVKAGQLDRGVAELQALSETGADTLADLPLVAALMQQGRFDAALQAIERLEKKQTEAALGSHLRGRVLLEKGERSAARQAFEEALRRDPSYFQSTAALVDLALRDGQHSEAETLLAAAVAARPQDPVPLVALANAKQAGGAAKSEIEELLQRAVRVKPDDSAVRAALIKFRLDNRAYRAALDEARAARSALPNDVTVMELLGSAELLNGNIQQAQQAFSQWASRVSGSPRPWIRMAEVHRIAGSESAAVEALSRAAALVANAPDEALAISEAYLGLARSEQALRLGRDLQASRASHPAGYLVEGQIHLRQRRWSEAVDAYKRGLSAVPRSSELAMRMYSALVAARRLPEAEQHAQRWLQSHAKDAQFLFFLGTHELREGRSEAAEAHFRKVLAVQPENGFAMNNVAWLMATAKKPGAVDMAKKAVALLPANPVVLDTLALALMTEGRHRESLEPLRRALALAPANHDLRLRHAEALLGAGDLAAAGTELAQLEQLGARFPRQAEVKALRARL